MQCLATALIVEGIKVDFPFKLIKQSFQVVSFNIICVKGPKHSQDSRGRPYLSPLIARHILSIQPLLQTKQTSSLSRYNKDCTAQVKAQFSAATFDPVNGTNINVSDTTLIPDPALGIAKQCSVTFGSYITGNWHYRVAVDIEGGWWTLNIPPAILSILKRRLNNYSAAWAGQDYTQYVRQKYIADTINNPPTATTKTWNFTPSLAFFGPDPNPGVQKMFTTVFRYVNLTGYISGQLIDPDAPAVWTEAWWE